MKERDAIYALTDTIELDTAYIGGRDTGGKRGKGSTTKTSVLVACQESGKGAGFLKMQVVSR
jgi:hypothetical protein